MATPTQAEIAVTRDVIYKREPGHDLPLDVYEPSSYLATIVDVHGGGWFHGDKAKDEDLATRLAKRGFRVVVPNYRLTPEFRFPAGVDDVLDAGVWARSTAATGLKKVGFIGSSAGGNLVVEAALATGQPAVSWSGPIYMASSIWEFVPPDGALAMQRALMKVGVESIVHVIPGTQHAKGYMDIAFDSSVAFLTRTLGV